MTREDALKEINGLVPVIVHWTDAVANIEDTALPGQQQQGSPQVTTGFLNTQTGQLVGLFSNVSTDLTEPRELDTLFTISGALRAITYLVPERTEIFETTVRKARTIKHTKGAKKR
jgi:hypothetical protein